MKKKILIIFISAICSICMTYSGFAMEVLETAIYDLDNEVEKNKEKKPYKDPYEIELDDPINGHYISLKTTFPFNNINLDKIPKYENTTFVHSIDKDKEDNVYVMIYGDKENMKRIPYHIKYLISDYGLAKYESLIITYYNLTDTVLHTLKIPNSNIIHSYLNVKLTKNDLIKYHNKEDYLAVSSIHSSLNKLGIKW